MFDQRIFLYMAPESYLGLDIVQIGLPSMLIADFWLPIGDLLT